MRVPPLHVSATVVVFAAGLMVWWLLAQSVEPGSSGARIIPARRARPASSMALEKFTEPDLPQEAGPAPLTDTDARDQNKVAATVIPRLHWEHKALSAGIGELRQECDINFILNIREDPEMDLDFQNIALLEVMKAIEEKTGGHFEVQPNAVVLRAAGESSSYMTIKTFYVSAEGWGASFGSSRGGTGRFAKDILEEAGFPLETGAFAAFDAASRRLVVKARPVDLKRLTRLMETGSLHTPFAWHPVAFAKCEYLPAEEVRRFYYFVNAIREEDAVLFKSEAATMRWRRDERALSLHGIRFHLHQPIEQREDTLWISRADLAWTLDPLLRPLSLPNNPLTTVVLDVFPAGRAQGTPHPREAGTGAVFDLAARLKTSLEAADWTVVITSTGDREASRGERAALANRHPDAVFVSLRESVATEVSTHLSSPRAVMPGNPRGQGLLLAAALHSQCLERSGSSDGGVRSDGAGILPEILIPAVLLQIPLARVSGDSSAGDPPNYVSAIIRGLEQYRRETGRVPKPNAASRE